MILSHYIKQPADRVDYDIEYSDWLSQGDSPASAVAIVSPVVAGGLVADAPVITGTRVKVFTSAGVNGATYKVTVTTTTAQGRIKQDEFQVRVRDY